MARSGGGSSAQRTLENGTEVYAGGDVGNDVRGGIGFGTGDERGDLIPDSTGLISK